MNRDKPRKWRIFKKAGGRSTCVHRISVLKRVCEVVTEVDGDVQAGSEGEVTWPLSRVVSLSSRVFDPAKRRDTHKWLYEFIPLSTQHWRRTQALSVLS